MTSQRIPFTDIDFHGPTPEQCQWFAGCTQQATHMVAHPILDWVPTCAEHVQWIDKMDGASST